MMQLDGQVRFFLIVPTSALILASLATAILAQFINYRMAENVFVFSLPIICLGALAGVLSAAGALIRNRHVRTPGAFVLVAFGSIPLLLVVVVVVGSFVASGT